MKIVIIFHSHMSTDALATHMQTKIENMAHADSMLSI